MPIKDSAKKSLRQTIKRTARNSVRRKAVKDLVKKLHKAVAAQEADKVKAILPLLQKALDKAAKVGVIKKNTASRQKSRLMLMAKKAVKK